MDYNTVPSATTPDQANSLFLMRAKIAGSYHACHYGKTAFLISSP